MLEMIDWSLVLTMVVGMVIGILIAEIATVVMWFIFALMAAIVNSFMS